jgi:hypothetical protein
LLQRTLAKSNLSKLYLSYIKISNPIADSSFHDNSEEHRLFDPKKQSLIKREQSEKNSPQMKEFSKESIHSQSSDEEEPFTPQPRKHHISEDILVEEEEELVESVDSKPSFYEEEDLNENQITDPKEVVKKFLLRMVLIQRASSSYTKSFLQKMKNCPKNNEEFKRLADEFDHYLKTGIPAITFSNQFEELRGDLITKHWPTINTVIPRLQQQSRLFTTFRRSNYTKYLQLIGSKFENKGTKGIRFERISQDDYF